jgi:CheY-like chemotaxis protein
MDILLIEDNDHRRVTLLKDLLGHGHRVTPCSSLAEAVDILRFIYPSDPQLQAVVISRALFSEAGAGLRQTIYDRFTGIRCLLLDAGHDAAWVIDTLARPVDTGLEVLLIEADGERCTAMVAHMSDRGDRVTACLSMADAEHVLATTARAPDVIVSDVALSDGDGLSFYLRASRRFPAIRWIVTAPSREAEFVS